MVGQGWQKDVVIFVMNCFLQFTVKFGSIASQCLVPCWLRVFLEGHSRTFHLFDSQNSGDASSASDFRFFTLRQTLPNWEQNIQQTMTDPFPRTRNKSRRFNGGGPDSLRIRVLHAMREGFHPYPFHFPCTQVNHLHLYLTIEFFPSRCHSSNKGKMLHSPKQVVPQVINLPKRDLSLVFPVVKSNSLFRMGPHSII